VVRNETVLGMSYWLQSQPRGCVAGEHLAEPDVTVERLGTRLETCLTPYKICRHILASGFRAKPTTEAVASDFLDVHSGACRCALDDVTYRIRMQANDDTRPF
jgi:hypothetical protein